MENRPLVKFIRNFIRDSSGVFPISLLVRISMKSFPTLTLLFVQKCSSLYNKKEITRWLEDMNFIFSWKEAIFYSLAALARKILFLPLENKIHTFVPLRNILYIWHLNKWEYSFTLINIAQVSAFDTMTRATKSTDVPSNVQGKSQPRRGTRKGGVHGTPPLWFCWGIHYGLWHCWEPVSSSKMAARIVGNSSFSYSGQAYCHSLSTWTSMSQTCK